MAAVGLKTHIWNNNLRSMLLMAVYPFLIGFIVWVIAFLLGWGTAYSGWNLSCYNDVANCPMGHGSGALNSVPAGIAYGKNFILEFWPAIFCFVGIWFTVAYFFQTKMVRALSHSHPVTRDQEPELYNLLENLCISRGMKMPKLEIIETHARNAFASGIDESSYTITVTRGLLQSMQRDEVEAVLGHELTHIINGDVRLLIISIIFTGMIGFFAQMVWSSIRFNLYRSSNRKSDFRVLLFIMVIAGILWIGYIATLFTRFALSRRREFMADAGAVELTKNPEAMMRALLRLAGKDRIPEATDDIALMCIENSRKFMGLLATHPPLAERIETLSAMTGTPIPELHPGRRAEERFASPQDQKFPWLTAARKGRVNPWA